MSDLVGRLKMEAQHHAGEARTANAIIAEIYQLCTGSTGEPGNWNGASPVAEALATARREGYRAGLEAAAELCDVKADEYDVAAMQEGLEDWEVFCRREGERAANRLAASIRAIPSDDGGDHG